MISIRSLSITYETSARSVPAVREVSLDIPAGKITAIVGESGGGKSSLVYGILRLLPPEASFSGSILYGRENIVSASDAWIRNFRWKKAALVTQGAMNSLTPVISVGSQIAEVLQVKMGLKRQEAMKRAGELLEMTGLPADYARRYPHELSGGQKQRAVIAMAMACSPDFLLADEPTSALDVITQAEVITTLAGMVRRRGMGLLLVTHDLPLAASICDTLAVMHRGRIVETGTPASILKSPSHSHTRELLSAYRVIGGQLQ
ncbi:MAG: ABC transporter ATP-binding protein [Thermovirgaceae bacterium]|nr:ABC transporter ATP-binding protein [Thermovirgaceae bacterium]